MSKTIFKTLLALFAFTNISWSQMQVTSYDSVAYDSEIIATGVLDFSASSIQMGLTSKFYRGGFITNDIKDASFDKHGAINRAGLDLGGEIIYRNYNVKPLKNKNWGIQIQGGYQNFGGMLYSSDLFGLAMYGNERYLGDTINMSGTDISFVSSQKIGFGLIDEKTKSSVSLNFYNISNRFSGDFRDLDVIQSEDGMNVQIEMDGQVELGQSKKFNQGFGFGVDIDYRMNVALTKKRDAKIQFLMKNIGFGYMSAAQRQYSFDTIIDYSGFQFEDLIGNNSILDENVDMLDALGIESKDVNPVFLLPGFLQVGKMVDENADYKMQSFFGVRLYPALIYAPFAFAGADYKANDWLRVGASVSYGGFTGFRTGIYSSMTWDKFQLGFGSDNMIGMVSKKGNGQSLYLKLRCKF